MLVIPAIDLIGGKCVRLYQGDFGRQMSYEKDPVEQAREFEQLGFPRIHVVDLEGARSGSGLNRQVIYRLVENVDVPVQTGGGIRREQDVAQLLERGVAYLIIGTTALESPDQVTAWVKKWGPERFVISLDLRGSTLQSEGWLQASSVELEEAIRRISKWGIRQVICTDVSRDGTLDEPQYETYKNLRLRLPVEVDLIAAGGISRVKHVEQLGQMGIQGAVVGRALYEGKIPVENWTQC